MSTGTTSCGPARRRDLGVDVRGRDAKVGAHRHQVADLVQERGRGLLLERCAAPGAEPGVDLRLQRIAFREQCAVARPQRLHDGVEQRPGRLRSHAGARRDLVSHEVVERFGDLDAAVLHVVGHVGSSRRPAPVARELGGGKDQQDSRVSGFRKSPVSCHHFVTATEPKRNCEKTDFVTGRH